MRTGTVAVLVETSGDAEYMGTEVPATAKRGGGRWDLIQFPMAGETSGILHRHQVRKNSCGPLLPARRTTRRRCLAGLWARVTSTVARSPPKMSVPP